MKLTYDNFSHCGFPEEYMFWILIFDALVIIFSYLYLHGYVRESHKKYGFYPVILLLFNRNAFFGAGLLLRKVFIISVLVCIALLIFFKMGYLVGFLTCGLIE